MATRHIQAEVQGRVLADQIEAPQDEVITETTQAIPRGYRDCLI
jgi:hypothetical protein